MIKLYDRIKERSFTIGTGNFALSGVFSGFSTFGSIYQNGDSFFYVANDGTNYELGSGVYLSSLNEIQRFPIKSSNSNNLVNFPEGLKEVYVNYPATNSVFSGSGIDVIPKNSGLAFWTSSNSLSSTNDIYIDSGNSRIGLKHTNPEAAIHIGGSNLYSNIKASGFIVGSSGIYFPSGNNNDLSYIGGQQLTHYEMNQVNESTGSNAVIELSGIVNQHILFKKQNAGTFFAGPVSGCTPPCNPEYPIFRQIDIEDLPDLSGSYSTIQYLNNKIDELTFDYRLFSDGRLSLSNSHSLNNVSGTTLYYSRFPSSGIILDNYFISLYDPITSGWNNYNIPTSGVNVNFSNLYDLEYKLYDVFINSSGDNLVLSALPWNNYALRSSLLGSAFDDFYSIPYATSASINSDLLLNETQFDPTSVLINGNQLIAGDTVLVKDQVDSVENGLYEVLDGDGGNIFFARGPVGYYIGDPIYTYPIIYETDRSKWWILDISGASGILGTDNIDFAEMSNNTTRSSQLIKMNSQAYLLNSDRTKRYLGTVFTHKDGIIFDTSTHRSIFNIHNQILKPFNISKPDVTWNYVSSDWRINTYLTCGSLVCGINDNNILDLNGSIGYSITTLKYNGYSLGIGLNDSILPSSGNQTVNIKENIKTDLYDNVILQLQAKHTSNIDSGFTTFYFVEKGRSGNGINLSINNDIDDAESYGGMFGTWYC